MEKLAALLEWIRPVGIAAAYFCAKFFGTDAVSTFHILGPAVVILMCGTVAFESLVLGAAASAKIGYRPDRAYQVQSGLNNLATAVAMLLALVLHWGPRAEAALVAVMLLFFAFSALNHLLTALRAHNLKPVNLLRPLLALALIGVLLPPLLAALRQ
jgi:predicted anti-sigma-YlaC factor YlaD